MKTSELKKMLAAKGCYLIKHGARHDQWFSPVTGKTFPVPRHDNQEVAKGTEKSIKKQAGV